MASSAASASAAPDPRQQPQDPARLPGPSRLPAERGGDALRVVDALDKIGPGEGAGRAGQARAGLSADQAETAGGLHHPSAPALEDLAGIADDPVFRQGVSELARGRPPACAISACRTMPGRSTCPIARGLDYYTGTVYETILVDNPEIGSICSGGRYDDLAGTFTKQTAARRGHLHRPDPAAVAPVRRRAARRPGLRPRHRRW